MRIAIFSDLHAHKFREFSKLTKEGVNDRLIDCVSVLSEIEAYCRKNKIEHVIGAGDIFHKRGVLDVQTFNMVWRVFHNVHVKWWLMPGNHDQANKSGEIHALESFRGMENVTIPIREGDYVGDVFVDFFPYQDSEAKTLDDLKQALKVEPRGYSGPRIPILHHGFKGARVGSSLEYEVKEPLDPKAIGKGWLRGFSEHYHHQQHLSEKLMYIGAPLEHTRHDRSSGERGFLVYDTDTDKVTNVPLKRPRFVRLDAGSNYKVGDVPGNFVDLVMEEEDQDLVKELHSMGARAVNPILMPKIKASKSAKRLDIDPGTDPRKVVKKYVQWSVEERKTDLDASLLERVGIELLKEAQT